MHSYRSSSPDLPRFALILPALLLAFALVACGGDDDGDSTPSATTSGAIATATSVAETSATPPPPTNTRPPRSTATPTATAGEGFEYNGFQIFGDFKFTDPIDFPENLMVLIETGCTQCDGPTEALYRVWRNNGETHVDHLFDAAIADEDDAYVTGFALRPDMSEIVVTVADKPPLASATVTIYRSSDGGRTWQTAHEGEPLFPFAVTEDGIVVSDLEGDLSFLGGDAIEPPDGAEHVAYASSWSGELLWSAENAGVILDSNGTRIAAVEPGSAIYSLALATIGSNLPVTWQEFDTAPAHTFRGWNVTQVGPDGKLAGFRTPGFAAALFSLSSGRLLGGMATEEMAGGLYVGYVDVFQGELTPIHGALLQPPFGDGTRAIGRNRPVAAVEGPFLRVTSGVNCLPIRADTDTRAQELACLADGALVLDDRSMVTVGAQEWLRVRLLDGRLGYGVAEQLSSE